MCLDVLNEMVSRSVSLLGAQVLELKNALQETSHEGALQEMFFRKCLLQVPELRNVVTCCQMSPLLLLIIITMINITMISILIIAIVGRRNVSWCSGAGAEEEEEEERRRPRRARRGGRGHCVLRDFKDAVFTFLRILFEIYGLNIFVCFRFFDLGPP